MAPAIPVSPHYHLCPSILLVYYWFFIRVKTDNYVGSFLHSIRVIPALMDDEDAVSLRYIVSSAYRRYFHTFAKCIFGEKKRAGGFRSSAKSIKVRVRDSIKFARTMSPRSKYSNVASRVRIFRVRRAAVFVARKNFRQTNASFAIIRASTSPPTDVPVRSRNPWVRSLERDRGEFRQRRGVRRFGKEVRRLPPMAPVELDDDRPIATNGGGFLRTELCGEWTSPLLREFVYSAKKLMSNWYRESVSDCLKEIC